MDDATAARKKIWGGRIAELRKRLGLTQKQLADKLDAEETSVARWEGGTVAPKGDTLYQLLDMARDIGSVWEFTGATLENTYEAMLKDPSRLSEEGVHVFLDMQLAGPQHFIDVLSLLAEHGAMFHRFGTPGTGASDSSARAFALFTLPLSSTALEDTCVRLDAMECVVDFETDSKTTGSIKRKSSRNH